MRESSTPTVAAEVVAVSLCGECPFAWDGTDLEDVWRCTAVDRGFDFRPLGRRDAWRDPPPRWCPLRRADRLVTLRADESGGDAAPGDRSQE